MLLFTPGPVAVCKEVALAQTKEMITHRGKEFQTLYKNLCEKIKKMVDATSVHVITGSGTAAIEANIQNALGKDGVALVLSNGAFGDKLASHSKVYYRTIFHRFNNAQGIDLKVAKPYIDQAIEQGAQLLCMTHHETSPGILNKITEVCSYAKEKGLLTLIDGTSAFPAYKFSHIHDKVDFYSWASQKAAACPPGIAVISLSEDALRAIDSSPVRCNYLNLKEYIKKQKENFETPTTPAISLLWALEKSLELIEKEGLDNFVAKHKKYADYVKKEIKKMGFELVVSEEFSSNTVVAFYTKKNKELNALLQTKYNVKLGGGHADWKETTLRFCVMGDVDLEKIKYGLESLKKAKEELGL
ncbi:MAG: aminotransferase class V-fold PLP-dependent enzyme [Candidatus Micrarchaeota archaeon]|nr:aminotransferase class V-fold PLP-dependent enzyme [Candidatus Micrarchaeota archaeon]